MNVKRYRVVTAEPAAAVPAEPEPAEIGTDSGMVEIKTRLPIHLHIHLRDAATRNHRSLAAELRVAVQRHIEDQARR